jgi:uncharacterized DUF497 family protein
VDFEWDEESKAGINFRKHGVRMPEAIPVFDDPSAITIVDDESDPSEQRFITLGRERRPVCSWWLTLGVVTTFELSLHVPLRITNARNMRWIDEG